MDNYFTVLGLSPAFDIDLADLEKRYFIAQREFHPDRLVGKSANERNLAISRSMQVNSAYETLKSPLRRIQHLLALNGIAEKNTKPDEALLMEVMELREELAEATTHTALEKIEAINMDTTAKIICDISKAVKDKNLSIAAQLALRLSYMTKMADEIKARKKMAG